MDFDKGKEHQEPPTKKQNAAPSRESISKARSQEVNTSEQRVVVEVSFDLESSGYNNSNEYFPLSENQHEDDMTVFSEEENKSIDIEEKSQTPKVDGDALLVEPNLDLGRCTAPLWLRQVLMPRGEVVKVQTVEDIQGLMEKEDDVRQKQMVGRVAKVIMSDDDGHRKVQIATPKVSKAVDEIVAQEHEIVEYDLVRITDDMECEEV